MAALDSRAYFNERALCMGLADAEVADVIAAGWTTMGEFAFSSAAPGSANDQAFVADVVRAIFPLATQALISKMRRLYFEAYTIMLADTRARVERRDDEPPRKMPRVERESRITAVKARLPGVLTSDERIPGASVIEAFGEMAELGQLKHLAWNKII
jgi:hypothetical protein